MYQLKPNKDFKNLDRYVKKMDKKLKTGVKRGLESVGMFLVAEIKKSITKKSAGSTRAFRRGKKVWVSPPNTSPNSDTGELHSSIMWEIMSGGDSVFVGSTVFDKGEHLELGTKNMKKRPYLQPNIEKNQAKAADIFMERIRKYMSTGR